MPAHGWKIAVRAAHGVGPDCGGKWGPEVNLTISSGVVSSGLMIASGTSVIILAGGSAVDTTVLSGGLQIVSGGVASGTVLQGGQDVINGGTVYATSVFADSTENINSGTVSGDVIESGGSAIVDGLGGAIVSATQIRSGGVLLNEGTIDSTVVSAGGELEANATDSGTQIQSGGLEVVQAGGSALNTNVALGGLLVVLNGGSATGTSGAGGMVSGPVVLQTASGPDNLGSNATGTQVTAGETLYVLSAGTAFSAQVNGGVINVQSGGGAYATLITDGGTEVVSGENLASGATIDGGSVLLQGPSTASGGFVFEGSNNDLSIGPSVGFNATISGFTAGDTIDLQGLAFASGGSASLSSGSLVVSEGGASKALQLASAVTNGGTFALAADGVGGTLVSLACFAQGTRIATPGGPVAVEDLRVGDRVVTQSGGAQAVLWLGHRRVDCRRHPAPAKVRPVRVAAGAFAEGVPARDLFLSPDHAVLVDGRLIPIRCLASGISIAPVDVDAVTYWHVELAVHDVLLAEGLACESFLDTGQRSAFANGGDVVMAHPEFARDLHDGAACAPLLLAGPALAAIAARLARRAKRRRVAAA